MKFVPNAIVAQNMANLQNTVRRLKIMLLSLSYDADHQSDILSSYSKNVAKPRYEPKDEQFVKHFYTSLNLRFELVFWCFRS